MSHMVSSWSPDRVHTMIGRQATIFFMTGTGTWPVQMTRAVNKLQAAKLQQSCRAVGVKHQKSVPTGQST